MPEDTTPKCNKCGRRLVNEEFVKGSIYFAVCSGCSKFAAQCDCK